MKNVQANDNGFLDVAKGANLVAIGPKGAISITNGSFNNNNDTGLWISSISNVTLTSVQANGNQGLGASIGKTDMYVQKVTISGMSTFYSNMDTGLEVHAIGAITLTNVDSAQNEGSGAILDNSSYTGLTPPGVSLLCTLSYWTNWFGENTGGDGLNISTKGPVVVNKIDASNNTSGNGIFISNETATAPANITINSGWMNNNDGNGLRIRSAGVISINAIEADYNGEMGSWINNNFSGSALAKPVAVNKSLFKNNALRGLFVQSYGNITINNITASGNSDFAGIELDNQLPLGIGTITVLNTLGDNLINNNQDYGLRILSNRVVSLTGVTANGNLGYGVWVDNYAGNTGSGNITMNKVTTRDNDFSGARVESNGIVNISSLVSMFNGELTDPAISTSEVEAGVTILTHSLDTLHKSSISSSVVMGNYKDGIQIFDFSGVFPWWWHPVTTSAYFGNNTLSPFTYHNLVVLQTP